MHGEGVEGQAVNGSEEVQVFRRNGGGCFILACAISYIRGGVKDDP